MGCDARRTNKQDTYDVLKSSEMQYEIVYINQQDKSVRITKCH